MAETNAAVELAAVVGGKAALARAVATPACTPRVVLRQTFYAVSPRGLAVRLCVGPKAAVSTGRSGAPSQPVPPARRVARPLPPRLDAYAGLNVAGKPAGGAAAIGGKPRGLVMAVAVCPACRALPVAPAAACKAGQNKVAV